MTRKPTAALIAAAAGLLLVLGGAAPASAAPVQGSISCPSFMVAKLSLTTKVAGSIRWDAPLYNGYRPVDSWISTSYNRTLTYYARANGPAKWTVDSKFSVYATCVR